MNRSSISGSFVVGNTTTNSVQLNSGTLMGVTITGSAITGTAMTFLVSNDGVNFYPLYNDSSTEVSLTIAGSARSYNVTPMDFMPWGFVKARLGTSASAVTQKISNQAVIFHTEMF